MPSLLTRTRFATPHRSVEARVPAIPPNRPQDPQRPFPYREEEVGYDNEAQRIRLGGTLTLPPGTGPFPAALLVTGSGLQDRNEEVAGHRPFLVLSDYLTRRGIAVLRVDDRGIGASTTHGPATTTDFATDVEAGVRYLEGRKDIGSIGIIGHSEGGLIAPMVAAKTDAVSFVVMLAGPGIPGREILKQQSPLLQRAAGAPEAEIVLNAKLTAALIDAAASTPNREAAAERARDALERASAELAEPARSEVRAGIELQVAYVTSPWMHHFLRLDPQRFLRRVHCPVLALNGTLDLQVPAATNLPAIAGALAAGGNRDATIVALSGLNHLFQTAVTGSPSEYENISETLNPRALSAIGNWIAART